MRACVRELASKRLSVYAAAACAPQGRRPRHRVCSVIRKSLAGVRGRYEYGGDPSPTRDGAAVCRLKMSNLPPPACREAPPIGAGEI